MMLSTGLGCRSPHQFPHPTLAFVLKTAVHGLAIDKPFLWYPELGISNNVANGVAA
jgi:hypothetical protein